MTLPRRCVQFAERLLLLFLLLVGWASAIRGDSVSVNRGSDPTGPHIVFLVPEPPHQASIGLARQLATLPIQRGKLTLIETKNIPTADRLGDFLARTLPEGDPADWIWIHEGAATADSDGRKIAVPTVRLHASDDPGLREIGSDALGTEVAVARVSSGPPSGMSSRGVVSFACPPGTPASRQIRYTRRWAIGLLRRTGSMAADAEFRWERLSGCAPRLIALYDAEGIGGAGPANLERIAAEQLDGAGVYRVCGEDIRDGALAPAAGVIFPGGSGRGIGDGLQAEGRQILRDFISAGGGYLGVCAGAYFAASGLDNYLQAIRLKHSQPWARGRAMLDIELTDEGRAFFGGEKTVFHTRYANGPVFLPDGQPDGGDPDFVVLARFKTPSTDSRGKIRSEMVGEAAIGSAEYGRGRLLIISPHPESHEEHHGLVAQAIQWTLKSTGRQPAEQHDEESE
ncbi:MAG: hypothetical protein KJ000_09680 [Pirellulaceae bacterium]|nr:hypothetical protein [Pirellulaceae bacterium]